MGAQQPFSKEKSRAVIDRFQQQAGPTDILPHHIRAMEKISKSPIISGNKVTLLRDGPETLASMKEAIRNAKDHIHIVVDGKTAFTGGINFYHVYAKSPYSRSSGDDEEQLFWRDTQIKIHPYHPGVFYPQYGSA